MSDLSNFFELICEYYDYEISEHLTDTEYKKLGEDVSEKEKQLCEKLKDTKLLYAYRDAIESRTMCYSKQASVVTLKHFMKMLNEIENFIVK